MLVKVDAGSLEWRTLIQLSGDQVALQEVIGGDDIHSKNQIAFDLPTRLISKIFLFRNIYRGSAWSYANDPAFMHVSTDQKFWQDVIDKFYGKYEGIDACHQQWKDAVVGGQLITIPSGREWLIPMVQDTRTQELKIPWTVLTNYPNQGLGADVMMLVRLSLWNRVKESGRKIKFISTVHDDIKFDTQEENVQWLVDTCHKVFADLPENIAKCWGGYKWFVPMPCEAYAGMDMLNMEEVKPSR